MQHFLWDACMLGGKPYLTVLSALDGILDCRTLRLIDCPCKFRVRIEGYTEPAQYEKLHLTPIQGQSLFDGYCPEKHWFGEAQCLDMDAEKQRIARAADGKKASFFDTRLTLVEQFLLGSGLSLYQPVRLDPEAWKAGTVSPDQITGATNSSSDGFAAMLRGHALFLHVTIEIPPDGRIRIPRWTEEVARGFPGEMKLQELQDDATHAITSIAVRSHGKLEVFNSGYAGETIKLPERDIINAFLRWWLILPAADRCLLVCSDYLYTLCYIWERCLFLSNGLDDMFRLAFFPSQCPAKEVKHWFPQRLTWHYATETRQPVHYQGLPGVVIISVIDWWRAWSHDAKECESLGDLARRFKISLNGDAVPVFEKLIDVLCWRDRYLEWLWLYAREIRGSYRDVFGARCDAAYRLLHAHGLKRGVFLPERSPWHYEQSYQGGFMMEAKEAFVFDKPVWSVDFQSFYPSLIIDYGMCPTTMMPRELAGSGALRAQVRVDLHTRFEDFPFAIMPGNLIGFAKPEGLLPAILREKLAARAALADQMKKADPKSSEWRALADQREAMKLAANVLYGIWGQDATQNNPFECKPFAEAVAGSQGRCMLHLLMESLPSEFTIVQANTDGFLATGGTLEKLQDCLYGFYPDKEHMRPVLKETYAGLLLIENGAYHFMKEDGTMESTGTVDVLRNIPIGVRRLYRMAAQYLMKHGPGAKWGPLLAELRAEFASMPEDELRVHPRINHFRHSKPVFQREKAMELIRGKLGRILVPWMFGGDKAQWEKESAAVFE